MDEGELKLLPCPFCGSIPEHFHSNGLNSCKVQGSEIIRCTFCSCEMSAPPGEHDYAVRRWNTRALSYKGNTMFDEKTINYTSTCCIEWRDVIHMPEMRFPILAVVEIGSGWGDQMDINDEGMEESIINDLGTSVPVCGTAFDGGAGEWFISPDCVRAANASGLTFISWSRVKKWRYLSWDEAYAHWNALLDEVKEMKGETK